MPPRGIGVKRDSAPVQAGSGRLRQSHMRMDIQAVVFDLDGTLLDRRQSFDSFVRGQWQRFGTLQTAGQDQYVEALVELDCDGYAPRRSLFTGALQRLSLPADMAEALLKDYREGFPNACVLFADAAQTLSRLRASGFKLGLITNGSLRMQSRKLECLSLRPCFDAILISDAEGISKPDPRIFHRAVERLGTDPAHAVFVGDHPDIDVAGARTAGLRAVWRRDPRVSSPVEADGVIDELRELVAWLQAAEPQDVSGSVRPASS